MRFLIQCVAGFEPLVAELLAGEAFAPRAIACPEPGLVRFEASGMPEALRRLPYANNVFLVLDRLGATPDLAEGLAGLAARGDWPGRLKAATTPRERGFKLVAMEEGQPAAADKRLLGQLGAAVERATGLAWSPRRADVELWAMRRRGGAVWLLKRLGRRPRGDSELAQGELRPELAHLLVRLSDPRPDDVMLDPFAGHGALPAARARLPYNMIFAIEADAALVAELKGRKKDGRLPERKKAPLIVRQGDARRLESLDESFVDAVVTDPPWGLYDRGQTDLPGLYRAVADELARVLKPGGRLVMLLGRGEATAALRAHAPARGLRETAAYDILVSGKKATAVKWIRVSAGDTGDDG